MITEKQNWINKIIQGDALDVMSKMPKGIAQAAMTSPPYNIRNSSGNGMRWKKGSGKWPSAKLQEGYDHYQDDMPDQEYISWQREIIAAVLDILTPDGALFYNHKRRVQGGKLQDRDDIIDGFPVRQIIIWDRMGGINHNPGYFIPSHELIYLIAKPKFHLSESGRGHTDVWRIKPDRNNPHPAPFPVELAKRAIASTDAETILDPFMGSGTTAVAAAILGRQYIGIDASETYCQLARERLRTGTFPDSLQRPLPLPI